MRQLLSVLYRISRADSLRCLLRAMLLLPAAAAAQTYGADENSYISVSYTIKGVQQTAMRQLEAGEFKGGHAYRFNITLNVSAIEFTVEKEIEAWDEVSAKEVTIE